MTPDEKCQRDAMIGLAGMVQRLGEAQIKLARGEALEARWSLYDMEERLQNCLAELDRLLELRGERQTVLPPSILAG